MTFVYLPVVRVPGVRDGSGAHEEAHRYFAFWDDDTQSQWLEGRRTVRHLLFDGVYSLQRTQTDYAALRTVRTVIRACATTAARAKHLSGLADEDGGVARVLDVLCRMNIACQAAVAYLGLHGMGVAARRFCEQAPWLSRDQLGDLVSAATGYEGRSTDRVIAQCGAWALMNYPERELNAVPVREDVLAAHVRPAQGAELRAVYCDDRWFPAQFSAQAVIDATRACSDRTAAAAAAYGPLVAAASAIADRFRTRSLLADAQAAYGELLFESWPRAPRAALAEVDPENPWLHAVIDPLLEGRPPTRTSRGWGAANYMFHYSQECQLTLLSREACRTFDPLKAFTRMSSAQRIQRALTTLSAANDEPCHYFPTAIDENDRSQKDTYEDSPLPYARED